MQFSKTIVAALCAAFVAAQGASNTTGGQVASGTTSGETPSGSVMVHVVKVGGANGELKFEPDNLKAKKGEMIQFQFWPKNHSIAQGQFGKGCEPLQDGFWSGYMPVTTASREMPVYTMMVEDDTKPMWFYCTQGKHCQGGMVGVVNANDNDQEKTLDKYKESCKAAPANIAPNSAGGSNSGGSSGSSGSSTLSTGVASPTGANGASATSSNSTVAATNGGSSTINTTTKSGIAFFLAAVVSVMLL